MNAHTQHHDLFFEIVSYNLEKIFKILPKKNQELKDQALKSISPIYSLIFPFI